MRSKLEEKLTEYERMCPITNDAQLLRAIELIIDEQSLLPASSKDTELLEEAVDEALSLRGCDVTALEDESIRIAERCFNDKKRKRATSLASLLRRQKNIACAIVLIIVITCMMGFTSGFDWLTTYISEKMLDRELGETVFISTSSEYATIDEMIDKLGVKGVLFPYEFPSNITPSMITAQISYSKPFGADTSVYSCIFNIRTSGESTWQEVIIESVSLGTSAVGEKMELCNREVTYYKENGRHCILFTYKGYTYTITTTLFDELEEMLSYLK